MESQPDRYRYIDSLRGLAALWVLIYHLWNRFYPGLTTQGHLSALGQPARLRDSIPFFTIGYGYSAVTLFFVLSGLCIHFPQARRRSANLSTRVFAARRFWRLYPAYAASIVLSVLALALPKVLLAISGKSFEWWDELHVSDALINAAFLQQVWPTSLKFNGVYWTLLYEVQFYAAYPALLWCLNRFGLWPVGTILLGFEVSLSFAPLKIPCFFLSKYFEWFLGVIAAEMIVGRVARLPGSGATSLAGVGLAAGVYASFEANLYPIRDLLFAAGYFGLILQVGTNRSVLAFLFDRRILATLGVCSYSLYLIHVPIIDIIWVGFDRLVAVGWDRPIWARWLSLTAIPISIMGAWIFYLIFEKPFFPINLSSSKIEPTPSTPTHAAP